MKCTPKVRHKLTFGGVLFICAKCKVWLTVFLVIEFNMVS